MKSKFIACLFAFAACGAIADGLPRSPAPKDVELYFITPKDGETVANPDFGKGQTEAAMALAPGGHRLQLLLGDYLHIPHDPPVVSQPITIIVK